MKTKLFLFIAVLFSAFTVNAQLNSVSIVGSRIAGSNWPGEPGNTSSPQVDNKQMTRVTPTGDDWTIEVTILGTGGLKFRGNNAWAVPYNWGKAASGNDYPSNTCTIDGSDIQGIPAGTYTVTFNSATGVYNFGGGVAIPVVKLVGSAVASPTGETMTFIAGDNYELTVNLGLGSAQFDIDGTIVGGLTFPTGTAGSPTESTPITVAKSYKVTYNNGTGDYNFADGFVPKSIALIGDGTPQGFTDNPSGIDTYQLKNVDNLNLKYRASELVLTAANVKFRQDNAWAVSWGGGFPTQANALGGGNIPVTPSGTYSVTLDRVTNTYNFFTPKVGIIGEAIGGWGDANEVQMTTTDGITYYLPNKAFTANGFKFRLDQNYDKAWGGSGTFTLSGVASTTGGNLIAIAGTYDVIFNRLTGAYSLATPGTIALANNSFATKTFSVSPNPTNNNWKIASANEITSVQVVNVLGKVVYTSNTIANEINVDASALSNGVYFARIASANAVETVKLIKN